ncbi:hypothetical protein BDF14DRAFT_1721957 [Spinellus fusiger]|nr:hypothetical protein BDF14DRAFT_1721718 [Spinellus fusiger]KAI7869973.1 hypothetical protein BDF14DRAFT_1721957 [Spinellus fusiger]
MLKKERFKLYLINEFKTSTLCSECKYSPLETVKHIMNPRPYQRTKILQVKCHGLLRSFLLNFISKKKLISLPSNRCSNQYYMDKTLRLWES